MDAIFDDYAPACCCISCCALVLASCRLIFVAGNTVARELSAADNIFLGQAQAIKKSYATES